MEVENNRIPFNIKLKDFEGPFDLLLFFIERDELDIQAISITSITDDFLKYIKEMLELNIALSSEFIFVAAQLMKIKSKSLLPQYLLEEDKENISADDLALKLIEYKKYRKVSEMLTLLEGEKLNIQPRGMQGEELMVYENDKNRGVVRYELLDLYQLYLTFSRLLERGQDQEKNEYKVEVSSYTIESQKKIIQKLLDINYRINCLELIEISENREHFVVNFISILEMLQQNIVQLRVLPGFNNFTIKKRYNM